jgi:hypothetical protein
MKFSRRDGCIRVYATDNVQVTKVLVTIFDEEGRTLEKGEAVPAANAWWEYTLSVPTEGNVTVEEFDLAGKATRQ